MAVVRGLGLLAALVLLTHCAQQPEPQPAATPPVQDVSPPPAAGDHDAGPEVLQPEPTLRTLTFGATADATTRLAAPDTAFGAESTLQVRRSATLESYAIEAAVNLRFEPTGIQGTVTRAVLRLYALEGSPDGAVLGLTPSEWDEATLAASFRWNDYAPLGRIGSVASGSWVELDVTAVVGGNGALDLALEPDFGSRSTTGRALVFASREHPSPALRPQLVVTADAALPLPEAAPSGCGAEWTTEVLRPTDDASVLREQPAAVQGTGPRLAVGGTTSRVAYLRFAIPERAGQQPLAARLRVYAPEGGAATPQLSGVDVYSWEETRVPGALSISKPVQFAAHPVPRGSWVEYDVTGYLPPRGITGFVLSTEASEALQLYSREAEHPHLRPQLLITRGKPCTSRGEGGAVSWRRQLTEREALQSLVTFPDGGFLTLGMASAGTADAGWTWALRRHTSDGAALWSRHLTSQPAGGSVGLWHLAAARDGSFVAVGNYGGAPDLGAGPLPAVEGERSGLLVVKFSADGQVLWSRGFNGGRGGLGGSAVAMDARGHVAVIGSLMGTVDFGGGPLRGGQLAGSKDTSQGAFLLVLDAQGGYLGSAAVPHAPEGTLPETSHWSAVAFDSKGNVLLGGHLGRGGVLASPTKSVPFVARYAPTGALQWYRRFDGLEGAVHTVAAGPHDELLFGGFFSGRHTFAGQVRESGAGNDLLLGALSAEGRELWARDLPGSGGGHAHELLADDTGHLVVLGTVTHGDLGGGPLEQGRFLARYRVADGAHRWSHALGSIDAWDGAPLHLAAQPGGHTLLGTTLPSDAERTFTLPFDGTPYRGGQGRLLLQLAP